jgi:toxin CptA
MIRATLKPSARLAALFLSSHGGAMTAIVALDFALPLKAALALAVAASFVHCMYKHAFLAAMRSVITIDIRDQLVAAIQTRKHGWRDALILGSTCVTPVLSVLNLRVDGERLTRHVLLVPGNVDADDFRRIRVLLRWSRHKREP